MQKTKGQKLHAATRCRQYIGYLLTSICWLGGITFGFWTLLNHDIDSGQSVIGGANATLVRNSVPAIDRDSLESFVPAAGRLRVIVAMHPKCPCTLTTLRELERTIAPQSRFVHYTFLVLLPRDEAASWIETETVRIAKNFPDAEVVIDVDSARASKLGLGNSGAVLVLQSDGRVLFTGGITSSRTCSARNPGAEAVASLLNGKAVETISTPAFGCPLK